jgi:Leishmanolysin
MPKKRVRAKFETYIAAEGKRASLKTAVRRSAFKIEVRFLGGLTQRQKNAFKRAANRWSRVIVGDLPSVEVDGEVIDDVLILAEGTAIDGPGAVLGQAGPSHLRPRNAGAAAFLPVKGDMSFDTADLRAMERDGTLNDVITHEMGHVLGIGTVWSHKRLLRGVGGRNPTFTGAAAKREYQTLRGGGSLKGVPVEAMGGEGTRDSHWRETVFANELMSGFVEAKGNPLSRVTVASLEDMGYRVNLAAAERYVLPDLLAMAERGDLVPHIAPIDRGRVLPVIPTVLPTSTLR